MDLRFGALALVAERAQVGALVECGPKEVVGRGGLERARNAILEDLPIDVEVGDAPAHAEEERQRDARLAEGLVGGVDGLIGLELLGLHARQIAFVDRPPVVAALEEIELHLVRVLGLLREIERVLGEDHLDVGGLHLKLEVSLGVLP